MISDRERVREREREGEKECWKWLAMSNKPVHVTRSETLEGTFLDPPQTHESETHSRGDIEREQLHVAHDSTG